MSDEVVDANTHQKGAHKGLPAPLPGQWALYLKGLRGPEEWERWAVGSLERCLGEAMSCPVGTLAARLEKNLASNWLTELEPR